MREAEGDKVTEILAPFLTFTVNDPILIWIKLLAFNVCKKKKKNQYVVCSLCKMESQMFATRGFIMAQACAVYSTFL